jgi:uncharacterized membrane protein YphA (DoxX/SURF4 family)
MSQNIAPLPAEPATRRALLAARLGLGAFFAAAGLAKLFALDATAAIIAAKGLPLPSSFGALVGAAELAAGAMLLADFRTRAIARVLILGVVLVSLVFHDPIGLPPGSAYTTAISLTMDLIILAGLAFLARSRRG